MGKDNLKNIEGISNLKNTENGYSFNIDLKSLKPKDRKKVIKGLASNTPDFQESNASWDKWSGNQESQFTKSMASNISQSPFEASYFEGPYGSFSSLGIHQRMQLAMRYFRLEPLAGKTIELMTIFANDGFKNEHGKKKIKKFYDSWNAGVDFKKVLSWIFLEYFRTGNVPTWREMAPYKNGMFDLGQPFSFSEAMERGDAAKKNRWTKQQIPLAYTVLNPLTVFVDRVNGYNDSLYFNSPMTDNVKVEGTDSADPTRILLRQLPHEMIERMKKTDDFNKVPLADKNVKRILRLRQPYEPYGNILMERAFAPIHEKNKLRQMDMSMVNSLINQIITVTIGNDTYPATPKQLNNLMNAFKNTGKSQILFWNHTLRVEVIRPDTKVLNKEKYERVNEDIRNAFGISEVLTGGGGSKTNFAIAYLSLKAFIANLTDARTEALRWVNYQYRDIAEAMQFDSYPTCSFDDMSLTDEVAEKQILMQLVDRKIISYESVQVRLGFDPDTEIARMENEKPLIEDGTLGVGGGMGGGSPYQQSGSQSKQIKKEDKKQADTQQSTELKQDRQEHSTSNPNKANSLKKPKPVAEGRPKSMGDGDYPKTRKIAKASDFSAEEENSEEVLEREEREIVLEKAKEILGH